MESLDRLRVALAAAYDITHEIGQGGMARVYLARDLKHARDVALKVIGDEAPTGFATERFVREIELCARLSHPHILPLLDSGVADGRPYFVMPYVPGDSVRDRLARSGRFAPDEAVALGREVADALDYAHAAGVLHRDVKPENVLLHHHHAVVLDFGVGRAITAASEATPGLTMAGMVVGTPAYMSPEQAAGEATLDGRSDQYSLAAMLYELLIGHPPFTAATAQGLIAKRFTETPRAVHAVRTDVPAHVSDAVARALALEPADRYPTVGEFGRALAQPAAGAVAASPRAAEPPSVAVVPFANVGGNADDTFLADGITDEVISALSRLRTLRVAARTSSYAIRGLGEDVAAIGARLKVAHLLEGSVQRAGTRIRIKARLVKVADGFQLWAEQFDRVMDDIFAIQDEIGEATARALQATVLADAGVTGVRVAATTPAAFERYLEGRFALNARTRTGLTRAVERFTSAVSVDPRYGPAHAGLADAYAVLGVYAMRAPRDVLPLARASATHALTLDPSLADAHATLGWVAAVYDRDWPASEAAFARALTLDPAHVAARQWRAVSLHIPLRRYAEALADIDRACALDPLSPVVGATAGAVLALTGDHAAADRRFDEVLAADPAFGMAHFFRGMSRLATRDYPDALAAFARARELVGDTIEVRARLAQAQAASGDAERARAGLGALEAARATDYVSAALIAQVHAALGDAAAALHWLGMAEQEHDPELIYLLHRPAFGVLRQRPEFGALAARLGLGTISMQRYDTP